MNVKGKKWALAILFGFWSIILFLQFSQISADATESKKQNFSTNYTLTGNGGTDIVNIAYAQIGKTGKQLGYTEDWCANFVSDCAALAGQSNAIPAHGRADCLDTNILNAGGYKVSQSNAQPGDIAFYDNNYNNSPDHVEIVYQVSGSTVKTFGGNTGSTEDCLTNKVSNPRTYGNILYIIRPNYKNDSNKKWYENYSLAKLDSNFSAFVCNSTTGGYLDNEGWNVTAYPGDRQKQQLWNFNRQSDGSYVITSMLDCNRLSTCDKKYDNRTSVVVTYDDIDDSQKWYIYDAGNKYIFRQIHSDRVMDLDNGGYAKGTNIQLYDFNNTSAQFFKIEKTDWYSALDFSNLGNQFCAYIKNNTTGGYLNNEGWNVAAYSGDESINQKWFFQRQSDGSYIITSILDNARLTTCDKKSNNGASIVVSHDSVNAAQKWYIYATNRGYVIRPALSNRVIDIDNGGYASGTNVQLYEYNCTYAQYYDIYNITVTFDVYFDANGGVCDAVYMSIFYGDTYDELASASRKGYNFLGWYTEKEQGDLVTNDTVYKLPSDQTLYAHWELVDYQILFDANGGICSKLSAPIQYRDTYGQLPEAQRDGYRFLGWYTLKDKGVLVTSDAVFLLTKDQTLYAHWELVDYQVSFDANGGSCSKLSAPIQYRDTYGQLPEAQRDGYRFLGWYTLKDKGVLVTSDTVFLLTKDQTLYAHWEKINLLGDLNGDTNITLTDLIPLQKHLLLRTHLTTEQSVLADLNSDGMINVIDLMLLKRTLLNP